MSEEFENYQNPHEFLIMWDEFGLEFVADITLIEMQRTWDRLKGLKSTVSSPNLLHLTYRAQFNSQRSYEIYSITASSGITDKDIKQMFESSPQVAADTIRKIGHCHLDNRTKNKKVIT